MIANVPFVDLTKQFESIREEVNGAIAEVLTNSSFILGKRVTDFENEFSGFLKTKYCIGVGSGLDALRLALAALEIGSGDEVIIPANTFIATALAVSAQGARPRLVDCYRDTFEMDPTKIEAGINDRTKAIIPVHLMGQPADMGPILQIAQRYNLKIIEDAAQAHGAQYRHHFCGTMGDIGCFSFYPGKNLGAYGDAGAVVTEQRELADKIRMLRNYGQTVKYQHEIKGFNSRMDTIQAAVLLVKLPHLNAWNEARTRHGDLYRQRLCGVGDISFQGSTPTSVRVHHLFVIVTKFRDQLQKYLADNGVQTGIHYPIPIHLQRAYRDFGYVKGRFPETEWLAERMLSLPMYAELTEEQIDYVTNNIRTFFKGQTQ